MCQEVGADSARNSPPGGWRKGGGMESGAEGGTGSVATVGIEQVAGRDGGSSKAVCNVTAAGGGSGRDGKDEEEPMPEMGKDSLPWTLGTNLVS